MDDYGVPGIVLMENAGRGTAELLRSLGIHGPVAICCGKGNNGGDGFVIARHLDNCHVPARVLLFASPDQLRGDAALNYRIIAKSGLSISISASPTLDLPAFERELASVEWVVDALLGTGLAGSVQPPYADVINAINAGGARVLAVDIPSGLDCDTGRPLGVAVRAQHTATFVAEKKGFANAEARAWLGQVHVLPIGAPRILVENPSLLTEG
jgi:NAD(P)H-hydrate epimerase